MTFEHEDKVYVRVEGTQCDECAFGHSFLGCGAPEETPPCWWENTSYIWKEEEPCLTS